MTASLCKNFHETKWSALNCTAAPRQLFTQLIWQERKKKRSKLTLIMMKNSFTLTKENSIKDTWGKACLQCYISFFKVPPCIYAHISIARINFVYQVSDCRQNLITESHVTSWSTHQTHKLNLSRPITFACEKINPQLLDTALSFRLALIHSLSCWHPNLVADDQSHSRILLRMVWINNNVSLCNHCIQCSVIQINIM